jgi:hypothetical protein
MVVTQFQKMRIDLSEILKPITSFCNIEGTKPWNGMVKVHLCYLAIDGQALLTGVKVFSLTLDEKLQIPKIAKGYNSIMPNNLLTVTVSSSNLYSIP